MKVVTQVGAIAHASGQDLMVTIWFELLFISFCFWIFFFVEVFVQFIIVSYRICQSRSDPWFSFISRFWIFDSFIWSMLFKKLIYDFEKMDKGIILIRSKAKIIPINYSKVSLKLEFVKIFIASLHVYHFGWFF